MRLLDDERGQSVQVGAAILLAFIVIAITVYQVQVVSSQNAEVEFNHQQEVRQDMVDLRNAISNAGATGEGEATTIKLGTQYPPRSIFVNPSPPRGILRTEAAGNLSLQNADVTGGPYTGDAAGLLDSDHRTKRLTYEPDYAELDQPGNLTIEHSLGFASFDNGATDPLTTQSVVQGESLTLTLLRGNVSEQGSSPVSVDPRTVSRTDRITIQPSGNDPIVLTIPTRTPDVWNETIGTTYSSGEQEARVERWDSAAGEISVSLNRSEYQLRMVAVGVGTGVQETDRYDVEQSGGDTGGGAYTLSWTGPDDESANGGASLTDCDSDSCTWDVSASSSNSLLLNATISPQFSGIGVDFALSDGSIGDLTSTAGTTDDGGSATTNLVALDEGTVEVLASANDDSDVIEIDVQNVVEDLVYADDATANEPAYGTNGQRAMVSFGMTNRYDGPVTITGFSYDSIGQNPAPDISEAEVAPYHEVWIDTNDDGSPDGNHDGDIAEGDQVTMDTTATVARGESAEIRLYHFYSNQGRFGTNVDMVGQDLTVTIYYDDPDGNPQSTMVQMQNIQG